MRPTGEPIHRPYGDEWAPDPARTRTPPNYERRPGATQPLDVGVARMTALALSVTRLDVIRRATVRALLPRGTRRKKGNGDTVNKTSENFGMALQRFDEWGWIERLPDRVIRIIDRDALCTHAFHGEDELPADLLHPAAALLAAEAHEANETREQAGQRAAELDEMRRLMAAPVPGRHRGRGQVWRAARGLPLR